MRLFLSFKKSLSISLDCRKKNHQIIQTQKGILNHIPLHLAKIQCGRPSDIFWPCSDHYGSWSTLPAQMGTIVSPTPTLAQIHCTSMQSLKPVLLYCTYCSIFSSVVQYNFPTSRVLLEPWGDIVDFSLKNNPAVIRLTMLKYLLPSENDFGFLLRKTIRSFRGHDWEGTTVQNGRVVFAQAFTDYINSLAWGGELAVTHMRGGQIILDYGSIQKFTQQSDQKGQLWSHVISMYM